MLNKFECRLDKLVVYFLSITAVCIPISVALQNFGFILSCLLGLIYCFFNFRDKLRYVFANPTSKWFLLFYAWMVIGLFYSNATNHWLMKIFSEESYLLGFFLLLFTVYKARLATFTIILNCYIASCLFVFVVTVLGDIHFLPNIAWFKHPGPYYMFFKIYGALFMAFGGYIALQFFVNHKKTAARVFYAISFLLITYNVLWMSDSRSGYIVYILLLLLFPFQVATKKLRIGLLVVIIIGLVSAFIFSSNFSAGLLRAKNSTTEYTSKGNYYSSTGLRLEYTKNCIRLWKQKPIIGYGTGGFLKAYVDIHGVTAGEQPSTMQHPQTDPENTYTFILVEHGLIGIVLLFLLYLAQIRRAFTFSFKLQRHLAQGFVLLVVAFGWAGNLLLSNSPLIFYLFFSVILFADYQTEEKLC
jgi:O-antigen ligase